MAADNPVGLDAEELAGNDLSAVEKGNGVHGPYELELGRAPVHHLGNRECRKCLLHHGGNKLLNGLALDMRPAEQPLALLSLQVLGLVNGDSV